MITYLINSLLCGLILYLAYILLLENENIHNFKRGYLLFSLIFFWFNPMLYLYRNKIKLNHEFLADKAVIRKNNNVSYYQTLLIGMACRQKSSIITSSFNFSLTKKRFIMMTRKTSKKKAYCRTLALIPVFIAAIAFFSTKITAQNNVNAPNGNIENTDNQDRERDTIFAARYKEYNQIFEKYIIKNGERKTGRTAGIGGKNYNLGGITEEDLSRLKELFLSMTPEQQNTLTFIFSRMEMPAKKVPTKEEFESWKSPTAYGIWLDGKRIQNSELDRYQPSDFSVFFVSRLMKNAKDYGKYIYHLDLTTTKTYEERKRKEEAEKPLYLMPNFKRASSN